MTRLVWWIPKNNELLIEQQNFGLAYDKFDVAKLMISVLDRVENILRKGENAGFQHFLLLPRCFQRSFVSGSM